MLERIETIEGGSKREGLHWEDWRQAERWMTNIDYFKKENAEGLAKYLEILGKLPKISGTDNPDMQAVSGMIDKMYLEGKPDPDFDHFYADYVEQFDPDTHLKHSDRFRRDNMMYRKDLPEEKIEKFYSDREWEKVV
jgi:hypothetical protein